MACVVGRLNPTPTFGLVESPAHGDGERIRIHQNLTVDIAGRPANGLDQRALRAQIALLVGVENRYQGHLGDVQPFAQQVDADQHVKRAASQGAQDLDPLDGVDVGVEIADLDTDILVIIG